MHQAHGLDRGLGGALARAVAAFCLLAALAACGTAPTGALDATSAVTRASTSTTGVAISDTLPGPIMHARMNDAGLIAFSTGSNAYVYDTRDKTLTDLDSVAPCPATGPGNRGFDLRTVTASGLVLYLCVGADGVYRSYVWDAEARTPAVLLPGGRTRAFDMNDAGTVVGWAIFDFQTGNARQRGFVWNLGDAGLTEILPPTANGLGITSAYSVNEGGQVLGSTPTDSSPFVLYFIREPSGAMTVVPDIEVGGIGDFEQALINDRGDMVGIDFRRFASPQESRVFHRAANGTITDLGVGQVRGFNEASTVLFSSPNGIFTWNAPTQALTPVEIPGGRDTLPVAINEAGQALLVTILDGDVRSLVWDPETLALTELGVPADDTFASRAEARALNDAGQVVGKYLSQSTFIGLVWQLEQEPEEPPPAGDPPTADAGGPYSVIAGNAVTLDGTGSSDPDGAALTYEWDLDFDGVTFVPSETGSTVTLETTAGDAGRVFTVALRVASDAGVSDVATASVMVISPLAAVLGLREAVRDLGLTGVLERGQTTGLIRTLDSVRRSLRRGLIAPACSQLQDFIDGVDDLVADGALPAEDGDALLVDADAVRSAIGCTTAEGL